MLKIQNKRGQHLPSLICPVSVLPFCSRRGKENQLMSEVRTVERNMIPRRGAGDYSIALTQDGTVPWPIYASPTHKNKTKEIWPLFLRAANSPARRLFNHITSNPWVFIVTTCYLALLKTYNIECPSETHLTPISREIPCPLLKIVALSFVIWHRAWKFYCRPLCKNAKRLGDWKRFYR